MTESAAQGEGSGSLLENISAILGRTITEIDTDSINELVATLTTKNKQCQLLSSQVGTLQAKLVRSEQVFNELEQSMAQKNVQNCEISQLKSNYAELSEEYKRAVNLNDTLRLEFEGLQFQIKNIEAKADQLCTQKLSLIEALEEKQKQVDQLNLQLHEVRQSSISNRDDQISKDQSIIQKNKEITHLMLSLNSLKSQIEQTKSAENWSQQEITRLNNELIAVKREKLEETSSLRASLARVQTAHDDVASKLGIITEEEKRKSLKILELQDALGKAQIQLKESEAMFNEELSANSRLVELYKGNCEELSQKLDEISGMSDENMMSQETVNSSLREELDALERENNVLKERIQELDKFVQTYSVSPTAAAFGSSHSAAENQHLQNELVNLKVENDRLKASLQEICRDVDDQVQVLQKEKRDNERLRSELASLSHQILSVCQQNERLSEDIRDTKAVNKQLEIKNSSLFSQVTEFKSILSGMDTKSAFDRSSAAIESLQRRNEELCGKIAELEEASSGSPAYMQKQLAEALDQIAKMKEQRDRQSSLLEALSRKENSASSATSGISKEHQQILSDFQDQISKLQRNNNHLLVEMAKNEANGQNYQQQIQQLQYTLDTQRADMDRTRAQLENIYCSLSEAQKQLQNTSIELVRTRDAERTEVAKAQKALIEASVAKESEARLQKAIAETNYEKERLLNVMNGLQAALIENEHSFERYREATSQTIESLQSKLHESNPRLDSIQIELISLKAENQLLKQRLQEQAKSMESLLETRLKMATEGDYQALKNTLEQYQAMQRSSEDAYNQLLNSFNNMKEAKDTEIQQLCASMNQFESAKEELSRKTNELQTEKASLEAKLQVIEGDGNQSLISNLEYSLYQTRTQLEKEISEHNLAVQRIESLTLNVNELQNMCDQLEIDSKDAIMRLQLKEEEYHAEQQNWEASRNGLEARIQELSQQNSSFFSQIEDLLKSKSFPITDEAFADNYDDRFGQVINILKQQKDVLQMDHEKTLQELRMTNLRLEQTLRSLDEARATLEHSKQNDYGKLERDYQALKEKFEQLLALRNSNHTLRVENTRLLSHITTLEQELVSVRESFEPLNTQIREIRAELAGKTRLVEQLQKRPPAEDHSQKVSELETNKSQLEQRVTDLDARYKRLMTALNNLRTENAYLKEAQDQFKSAEQERENLVREYEMKITLLSQRCELLKGQLEKTKAISNNTSPTHEAFSPLTEEDDEGEEFEEPPFEEHDLQLSSAYEDNDEEVEEHEVTDTEEQHHETADGLIVEPIMTPQKEEPPKTFIESEKIPAAEEKPMETTRKRGVIDLSMLKKATIATPVAPKPTAPLTSTTSTSAVPKPRLSSGLKSGKRKRNKKDK